MDEWNKFNEKVLPSKESFYSNLTLENITKMLMLTTYSKNLILII